MKNPLQLLQDYGQSFWLDYLRRSLITTGRLKRLVEEDGLRGLTSNPAIFEKAIAGSSDYQELLAAPESQGIEARTLYERIAVRDVQDAADILHPVYVESQWRDGYVSLEVSPQLAHETQCTMEEARRLWQTVGRENLMIKVPGTPEGMPAIQQLISEGINVNVTLLFAQETYEQAAAAYLGGLESLAQQGRKLGKVASVASFFISRIDTAVDNWIAMHLTSPHNPEEQAMLRSLLGKVATASAKTTYRKYLEIYRGERWLALARQGAQTQRLLWASTGMKNPDDRDVRYVEELIGPDTVNTMPPATLDAFRDHGRAQDALTNNLSEAVSIMDLVAQLGIPFKELTDQLLAQGVLLFEEAFDKMLKATDRGGTVTDHDPTECMKLLLMKKLHRDEKYSEV
jgi:transaldolase/glucose-6-phosphate isomerase